MHITLLVLKSGSPNSDSIRTVKSLKHEDVILDEIIFIDKFRDINYRTIGSNWFIILYDDEFLDERLLEALSICDNQNNFDVFSCYKIDQERKVSICPRIFKNGVKIEENHLYPIFPVKMEILLNGWIYS